MKSGSQRPVECATFIDPLIADKLKYRLQTVDKAKFAMELLLQLHEAVLADATSNLVGNVKGLCFFPFFGLHTCKNVQR